MAFRGFLLITNGENSKVWGDIEMLTSSTATLCTDGQEMKIGTRGEVYRPDKNTKANFNTPSIRIGAIWQIERVERTKICGCDGKNKLYFLHEVA
ncbi:hypothetical protein A2V49_03000 [candidate division WWE3 bacterium RBG_19FT_COMBO_34_6]|uniref:Uncharacterized protein n=1 Tax=candidate division WWE3 bacterium RBG_19FT_COMBO_34_6 TaxID=1802612 RepID=A0A1F4UKY7_UNCKA|nr:MAG: hypothetical protein A2V49_03000 [candidate division WWE3 bacterium RBG_19FT_COMBO_34_6]